LRIAAYSTDSRPDQALGAVIGSEVVDLGTGALDRLLDLGPGALEALAGRSEQRVPLDAVRLHAPVRPRNIVCIGTNYVDHALGRAPPVPTSPLVFGKFTNVLIGPGEAIRLPRISSQVDYEGELAVVIGRRARDVDPARALEHVFGYTAFNDVSARDLQFDGDGQWTRGKSLDTFGPVGPWIVTADEIPDPQALRVRTRVAGEVLQDAGTRDMIFGVAEIVAFVSQGMTLAPGDLIATGTPPGVGLARSPQRFLRAGDEVEIEVEGVGTLRNPVVAD
jgi:2,4-didehydro-3-deoxy-L-rhamnonate hydrolase